MPRSESARRTQKTLLETITTFFYFRGYHNTGIADITAATGLTKPALYHYFPSKEWMGLAYLRYQKARLFTHYRRWADRSASLAAYLENWVRMLETMADKNLFSGCPFALFASGLQDDDSPLLHGELHDILAQWHTLVETLLRRLESEGVLDLGSQPPLVVVREILSVFQGNAALFKLTGERHWLDQMRIQFSQIADRYSAA